MTTQRENTKLTHKDGLRIFYLHRLVQFLVLNHYYNRLTLEECLDRLRNELKKPGYCERARQYVQNVLDHYEDYFWHSFREEDFESEEAILKQGGDAALVPFMPSDSENSADPYPLKSVSWELDVLKQEIEHKEQAGTGLQFLHLKKLLLFLNRAVDLGVYGEFSCNIILKDELTKPYYCAEAKEYIQGIQNAMEEDEEGFSLYWWAADRRRDAEVERYGYGCDEPYRKEDDPRSYDMADCDWAHEFLESYLQAGQE